MYMYIYIHTHTPIQKECHQSGLCSSPSPKGPQNSESATHHSQLLALVNTLANL